MPPSELPLQRFRRLLRHFLLYGPGSRRVSAKDPTVPEDHTTSPSTVSSSRDMGAASANDYYAAKLAEKQPRVYKRRWAILTMFVLLSASNGAQWIMYSVIAQIVVDFYGVSFSAVDWTSMIYMATYIVLFIPAAYLLDRYGLRMSILMGATGNAVGAWIKMFSANPNGFWVTFIGQTIVGSSQMFTLGIPPRLAAVWFGPDEVSTACAAGVFGNQLGIAAGFLVPPILVHNGTVAEVARDLSTLFLCSATLNTAVLTMIIFFFTARPPTPPSLAQITAQEEKALGPNFWSTLLSLLTNKDFVILFITYGMNTGVFYAISTLLAQMVLPFYPTESVAIGQIGVVIVVAGMFGSVLGGLLLDKFKRFKLITLLDYLFSCLGMLAFTFTLDLGSLIIVFAMAFMLGFFMTGYLPIGFEFAAEITFPAAEGTTSGLLNASAQIFGILLTMAAGSVMHGVSTFVCNISMTITLLVGTGLTALITEDLKRQNAQKSSHPPTSSTQLTSISGD